MGRDCEARIGMRVVQLDPLVDIRECSQATNAFLHSHGLPQAALGLIMRILGQTCAVWVCLCAVSCFSGAVERIQLHSKALEVCMLRGSDRLCVPLRSYKHTHEIQTHS